ncbi:MAG: putative Zn-dependent protease [Candidatus Accumulibacter sp. BA-94]|uniref:tetratricopeptide repeat protein n=1 Tax=Accumulibacter sp. TaxID=2053492 RepID=UPI000446FA52|nr:tetratricopeptide repeat protein [Accumulibacter sp.]EXI86009.1 MAG: putative Zn-dependent protease [Candidatus Accumulibacter sp. BA-94]MBL8391949.1 tetratricopeptide repeat protein [Accumulibacter sp.]HRD87356.1 tetratricopeptide repeat protein [Accumulibacter sp.]
MFSDANRSSHLPDRLHLRLACVVGLWALTGLASGQVKNMTAAELAAAPRYCPYTQAYGRSGSPDAPSAEAKRWVAILGPTFWHLHHYCWGKMHLQRAMRSTTSEQERKHLLSTAVGDYGYVIKNGSRDFILLPEIYVGIGEIELLLAHPQEANRAFAAARALKPDYGPAYSHWAEFLMHSGQKAEAKQLVKTGLEYNPDAKTLREQYRLLGGNPSEIVPRVKESKLTEPIDDGESLMLFEEPEHEPEQAAAGASRRSATKQ